MTLPSPMGLRRSLISGTTLWPSLRTSAVMLDATSALEVRAASLELTSAFGRVFSSVPLSYLREVSCGAGNVTRQP